MEMLRKIKYKRNKDTRLSLHGSNEYSLIKRRINFHGFIEELIASNNISWKFINIDRNFLVYLSLF